MGDLGRAISRYQDQEWADHEARSFNEYDGTACKFCRRLRVGVNDDGRRYCEKCDRFQDTEFGEYAASKEGE